MIFLVLESSVQELEHTKFTKKNNNNSNHLQAYTLANRATLSSVTKWMFCMCDFWWTKTCYFHWRMIGLQLIQM